MRMMSFFLLVAVLACAQQAEKQPFAIAIEPESPTVTAGSEVWIKLRVTNNSDRDLDDSGGFSSTTGLDPNFKFNVTDENGKLVAKRTYLHPELEAGNAINRVIPAGQTLTQEQRVSALYDMKRPGKYSIQASRQIPQSLGGGIAKSNVITIIVSK